MGERGEEISRLSKEGGGLAQFFGLRRTDRQIHHPAAQRVKFPINVIAACSVTSHSSEAGLSKKCQVQAHIALINAGSIARERVRHARFWVTLP